MAQVWLENLVLNAVMWKIDPADVKAFEEVVEKAAQAYHVVQNKTTATPVAYEECSLAFAVLESAMRDFKRQHFTIPPLDEAVLVSLGLHSRSPGSVIGDPTAQVTADIFLAGRYELGAKFSFVNGSADDPANKGFRLYYAVVGAGSPPPESQEDLHEAVFTRRQKCVVRFSPKDSGKTCFMAVRIENDGVAGPWGPMSSCVIP
jgi:hypothetical protein